MEIVFHWMPFFLFAFPNNWYLMETFVSIVYFTPTYFSRRCTLLCSEGCYVMISKLNPTELGINNANVWYLCKSLCYLGKILPAISGRASPRAKRENTDGGSERKKKYCLQGMKSFLEKGLQYQFLKGLAFALIYCSFTMLFTLFANLSANTFLIVVLSSLTPPL